MGAGGLSPPHFNLCRKGVRPVKTGCWFVGGDLTGAVHDIAPVVTTTSIILCFNKHQLTQVYLEKWPLQRRVSE